MMKENGPQINGPGSERKMTPEEFYKEIGADYQTALSRMMGNQGLLARMLKKFENDRNYEALEKAVENEDYGGVFAAAHTLKGVAGNLELTPLYETCTRLSDATRGGKKDGDVQGLFLAVREAYRNVMENVKKLA